MALFTHGAKLDLGAHIARCATAKAVYHAVGISRQRNSGYRPSRAQSLSIPDPSLSPTHLSIKRGHATPTHYTHHQVSLVVPRNNTLVLSLGLRTGPACEAGLIFLLACKRSVCHPKERKKEKWINCVTLVMSGSVKLCNCQLVTKLLLLLLLLTSS